jgi:hypothetical protein
MWVVPQLAFSLKSSTPMAFSLTSSTPNVFIKDLHAAEPSSFAVDFLE